jgi:hypothetical protein
MMESYSKNEIGHRGNRFDQDWKRYWLWHFIMGGRKAYEAQKLNIKCIPHSRTLANSMDSVSKRYMDGKSENITMIYLIRSNSKSFENGAIDRFHLKL